MIYSDKVMDHFQNPRNVGMLKDADGVGKVGNPVCGDMMTFYIMVKDNRIADVKFQTFGCGAAIAVSSMVSEMALGKTLDEALKISNEDVAAELGGLPKNKLHCSNLGADALHKAIEDYQEKQRLKKNDKPEIPEEVMFKIKCPYCDSPVEGMQAFCKMCRVEFEECWECSQPIRKDSDECPHCGATRARV
jgi:nitrogen fixation protein NifU and related proteins